jgi:cellulose biosynthesis protein BcsQ
MRPTAAEARVKIVAFASFKGGSGKTTALMAACSSLVAQGVRVALFEADRNAPLSLWRERALAQQTWDEDCRIFPSDELASFEASFEAAEKEGYDVALVDTHGGASDLNDAILVNADLVVVPTTLTALDLTAALDTIEYVVQLFMRAETDVPFGVLLQRLPTGRLSISQQADLDQLAKLPLFESRFHARDAFASLQSKGLLHKQRDLLAEDPAKRIMARHVAVAVAEADAFAKDIRETLELPHGD